MLYPVVITDFDGTLRHRDRTVSDFTRAVVREFVARGGLFVIATGRITEGILSQLERIGLGDLDFPLITYQGAHCETSRTHRVLFDEPLPKGLAHEVISYCKARGIPVQTYWDGAAHANAIHPRFGEYCEANGILGVLEHDLTGALGDRPVYKVLCWIDAKTDPHGADELARAFDGRCKIRRSASVLVDAFPLSAGKDRAIEALCAHYGHRVEDCMAFGDQANDADMVRVAGLGVAVGNAVPELKAVAKRIAPTCDDDGVATVMNEVLRLGVEKEKV